MFQRSATGVRRCAVPRGGRSLDGGKTLVLMAAGEWSSIQATAQLLWTEGNRAALARSLARSLARAAARLTVPIDLDDL